MTIRRNVDLSAINDAYRYFETACERAPEGTFEFSKNILFMLGTQCDALLGSAKAMGVETCNCDGIREIEVLMFDMIRRKNEDINEIEQAIGLGRTLVEYPEAAARVLAGLERDRDFLSSLRSDDIDMDDGLERQAQMIVDPPEIAELQQDGTWAIKRGLAFIKGGFRTEAACERAIDIRLSEMLESMQ